MFQNWLNPTTVHQREASLFKDTACFIRHIQAYETDLPNLESTQIALIGMQPNHADAIRKALYSLSYNFKGLNIVDLGNLKKDSPSFVIPILKELYEANILPILIGGNNQHIYAQYQAHYTKRAKTNLVVVDERVHFDVNESDNKELYLSKILNNRKLFHLSLLSNQSHFTSKNIQKYFANRFFDLVGLGNTRAHLEEVEPLLRDADLLAFNIEAIRYSEAPAQNDPSPNGLFGEEACQISRYAGLSDKLSSVGFYGYNSAKDETEMSAKLVAQMCWYFIDGYYNRKHDFPKSTDNLVEYIVDQKEMNHQITFWKSNKSGRWWMEVPVERRKKPTRHHMIPCSYNDYQKATRGELPERLMNAYQRFL